MLGWVGLGEGGGGLKGLVGGVDGVGGGWLEVGERDGREGFMSTTISVVSIPSHPHPIP